MPEETPKQDIGAVEPREITAEMEESYLDYAMSVIVSRALPDVRDGLKPVHRRILYAMQDLGLTHAARFKKSANVVGEVLGKYHPHGDVAVYDSLARLAQDFSMRYPLVDGQGNFGSVDGDSPAAMRYTETRLTKLAEEMLADIEKETVNFGPNYDGSRKEPLVLPAKVPQLLLNGTMGIAVGMATNIPPHNLREVADALTHLIDHPRASLEDLLAFVKGPDFPTGGIIYSKKDIAAAYATGRGPIVSRGVAEIEEGKGGQRILITELPYQVNKAAMLEHIAELVKDKKIDGIRDLRDESDKEGLRVAVDLKPDAHPQKVLNALYKHTDLQRTFHVNMLALADGIQPEVMSLKSVLEHYLKHREAVVRRRAEFDLRRAEERAHILEGLHKALDHIDAVISTIRKSETKEEAHANLVKKFAFTDAQATAILEMRLATLAGLERQKIEDELKEKKKLIKELIALLKSPEAIRGVIKQEILEMKHQYGDERRTKVVASGIGEFSEEDLIPQEDVIVTVTQGGYIKRLKPETYRPQKRGGKGVIGMETKEEDVVKHFVSAKTHDNLLFFTNRGRVFQTKAYEIPEGSRQARGKAIQNFLAIDANETVTAVLAYGLAMPKKKGIVILSAIGLSHPPKYLVMTTAHGIIKKTPIEDFSSVRRSGLLALKLKKADTLGWVRFLTGSDHILIVTREGQSIRFSEKDVRPMGRPAAGVTGIRLRKNDEVVGMEVIQQGETLRPAQGIKLLVVMEKGYGKKTELKHYKKQRRAGIGIKTANLTPKTGKIVAAKVLGEEEKELIAISAKGQVIRTSLDSISTLGRATQGVRVMRLQANDRVASIATL
ncbi:DNA gyrase subunit A [Candidatus Azambacteria bacterium]|nr:DNA gyrase subunit A [Candidatus Azambacteria bacterium]